MVDRTVKTTLTAQVSGYLQGMDMAARKTREMGSEAEKLAAKRQAFQTLGASAIALGVAIAAAVGLAVVKYADFDQAMSNANAVLQESVEGQRALRDATLEAGGATVFTAHEAANGVEELGKAGIGTADILSGALTGSLDLAASGQLGVARASEITGITLKQFALDGTQAARVADVLSAGANKAVGSVEDLAQGLKFVGPVAASMNVSLEDTVATLALFADRGVIGEQAGTSLRGMLSSLTSPSKQAKDELDRLNLTLYDGNGRFLGLENAAGELQRSLGGVSDAERDMSLGILFGNQQVTAARILVEAGAETWRDYRESVDDTGIAARVAAERMDNLAGDVEKLGGAFDTALIKTGSGANDVLRGLVQTATFLVDAIGELPEPVLGVALAFSASTAAVLLLGGAALRMVPGIAQLRETMLSTGISAGSLAGKVGIATAALTIATIVVGAFVAEQAAGAGRVDSFRDSLDQASGAVTRYTRELVIKRLEEQGAFEDAAKYGISQRQLTDAVIEGGQALEDVQAKLDAYSEGLTGQAKRAAEVEVSQGRTAAAIRGTRQELSDAAREWENATAAAEDSIPTLNEISGAAEDARGEVAGLSDELRNFGSITYDVIDAELQFRQAIDDATAAVGEDGFTRTLDRATQAGRDNWDQLLNMGAATNEYAAAAYDASGSQEELNAILGEGWQRLYDQAIQFGATEAEAKSYADQLIAVPSAISTRISFDASPALAELARLRESLAGNQAALESLSNWRPPSFSYNYAGGLYENGVQAFASGGFPSGVYAGVRGGIHKFAESEMGVPWETYISGRTQDRARNLGIWAETGERLGAWRSMPAGGAQQSGGGGLTSQQIEQLGRVIAANMPKPDSGPVRIDRESIRELVDGVESRTELLIRAGMR